MEFHKKVERLQAEIKRLTDIHQETEPLRTENNHLNDLYQEAKWLQTEKTQEASSLFEERSKILSEVKELNEITRKEEELTKVIESFKQDAAQSYLVGFKAALEQVAVVHPSLDFWELDPGKTMVDGQLRKD